MSARGATPSSPTPSSSTLRSSSVCRPAPPPPLPARTQSLRHHRRTAAPNFHAGGGAGLPGNAGARAPSSSAEGTPNSLPASRRYVATIGRMSTSPAAGAAARDDLTENQANLLKTIRHVRKDRSLCDVELFVGKEEQGRKRFLANSTILALRSTFFKKLFFEGSNEYARPEGSDAGQEDDYQETTSSVAGGARKGLVVDDVDPDVFQKMLDFLEGSVAPVAPQQPGDQAHEDATSAAAPIVPRSNLRLAWSLRYAAKAYGVPDLVDYCDKLLVEKLTFRNGLDYLVQASANGAHDFKERVFSVLQFRGRDVLAHASPATVAQLMLEDVLTLVRLFRDGGGVSPDRLMGFVQQWGAGMDNDTFVGVFRSSFFPLIPWEKLSVGCMQAVHDLKLLELDRENEMLLRMLWARERGPATVERNPAPSREREDTSPSGSLNARLVLKIKQRLFDNRTVFVSCLLIKVARASRGPSYASKKSLHLQDNYFVLDASAREEYMRLDKEPSSTPCGGSGVFSAHRTLTVDPDDISVSLSSQDSKGDHGAGMTRHRAVELSTRAYYLSGEDSLLLLVSFRPVALGHHHDRLTLEVGVARELLPDARVGNLQTLPPPTTPAQSPPRNLSAIRSIKGEVVEFEARGLGPAKQKEDAVLPFVAAIWFK